jgi:hypothetical protein
MLQAVYPCGGNVWSAALYQTDRVQLQPSRYAEVLETLQPSHYAEVHQKLQPSRYAEVVQKRCETFATHQQNATWRLR